MAGKGLGVMKGDTPLVHRSIYLSNYEDDVASHHEGTAGFAMWLQWTMTPPRPAPKETSTHTLRAFPQDYRARKYAKKAIHW